MKNLYYFLMLIFVISACVQDEDQPDGFGSLSINIGIDIKSNPIGGKTTEIVPIEDFVVIILNEDGSTFMQYDRASDVPSEIELPTGSYKVISHSNNDRPAEFENPYYYGESETFSIDKEEFKVVDVTCEIANMMVTVTYSDNVVSTFDSYNTSVINSTTTDVLVFNETETRSGYFSVDPLLISAELTYEKADGSFLTKEFTGSVSNPQPKTHYEIRIDASVQDGQIAINLTLDETLNKVTIELTEAIPDPILLGNGDLIITEVMNDPFTLTDSQGEYFELFNTTPNDLNLKGIVIQDNGVDQIEIQSDVVISSNDYLVMARSENATMVVNKYVYGEGFILTNSTDDEIIILNSDLTEVSRLEYDFSFPNESGASMNLDINRYSDLSSHSDPTSWCTSTNAFETGDFGTPGAMNEVCINVDADGDGYNDVQSGGYDCDDSNYLINPSQVETCNGIDDNCDGIVDEGCVYDICDGVDNDNDGTIDNITWYLDADGDGYGSTSVVAITCNQPTGGVLNSMDCDDSDPAVHPGSPEICNNMLDEDCNGVIDDGC